MTDSKDNEVSPEGRGDVAVIGEGTPHRMPVSIQVLQNIYHELTGKNEEMSKSYDDAFRVTFADFEQLDHRITQTCEQYSISTSNCSIKVYYINDTQQTFSSFNVFRAFNAGSSSAVESVLVTYNFLILLPKLNQPQSYTLTIRVASKVSIENKMQDELYFEMPKILRLMGRRTAVVAIKYVDYMVARNMLNVVDEWFKALPKSMVPAYWAFIRKRSSYVPLIARYFVAAVVALIIFTTLPSFVPPGATLLHFAKFWLLASVGLFAAYRFAHHLGSAAEDSIDRWSELSYVSLTSGDKAAINEAEQRNRHSIVSACLKLLGVLLISVVTKVIVELLVGN
ncbi:MAG: hypothetical protein Q8L89_01555 [Gammaproteobacteria bacterium]|nr:hypothetical protein [Gammaproteobacteria bacterium]